MNKKLRRVLHLIAVCAAALVVSACLSGGADSEDLVADQSGQPAANSPPTISGTPPAEAKAGESYSFTPSAADADGDTLTFSISNKPSWATFDSSKGSLSGTPDSSNEGSYDDISISVSDGTAKASLPTFNVTVVTVGGKSVTLSWTAPTQNSDGSPLLNLAAYNFYYGTSEGNYPNRIHIDNPGISTYVVENLVSGTYYFVATAENSQGTESDYSNVVTKKAM